MAGRIALVTGANRGLGLEMVKQLAASGATVLLGARNSAKGEAAAAPLRRDGLDVSVIELDLESPPSVRAAAKEIAGAHGRLDVLVNNAAVLNDLSVQPSETDEATLRSNFEVNFFGPFLLIRDVVPLLRMSSNACVVNIGTQVGSFSNLADPDSPLLDDICPAYQASKIALNAATVLFAKELRDDGIKVNAVCPGWVMTDMGHEDLPDYGPDVKPLSAAEAVAAMRWLTQLSAEGPTGGFFNAGEPIPW